MRYLILTTLIWAFSFGLIGNKLEGLDPLVIGSTRLLIALLAFLPFLRSASIAKDDQLKLVGIGAVQFGIMYICYLSAFRYIPSHLVALFSVLTPLYVVLIHDLRQRQFHLRYLIAAFISIAGAGVIRAKGGETGSLWIGFLLMQIAGVAFAFGQVAYRDFKQKQGTTKDHEVFVFLYAGGAATALIASLLISPNPLQIFEASWTQLGWIFYLGAIASGLGFFLWNKGATLCTAGALAASNNLLVPMAILVSLFVFKEIEGATAEDLIRLAIGAALIGAAVLLGKKRHFVKSPGRSG